MYCNPASPVEQLICMKGRSMKRISIVVSQAATAMCVIASLPFTAGMCRWRGLSDLRRYNSHRIPPVGVDRRVSPSGVGRAQEHSRKRFSDEALIGRERCRSLMPRSSPSWRTFRSHRPPDLTRGQSLVGGAEVTRCAGATKKVLFRLPIGSRRRAGR